MGNQEDILKGALLLEKRSKALYEGSAQGARSAAVREIFLTLAHEEGRHIEVLSQAFADLMRTGRVSTGAPAEGPADIAGGVLTEAVKAELSAASYEAAALYAAMALEERAVAFYSEAERTSSGEAKALYSWLARWERSHLDLLTSLDQELRQKVWNDQRFWPF
ncbi:MAG: ferritin family protein [Candidatus Bipolaricaulis sp.]|nr:ferritin family protein [Candidatus Bipolaricaulis sp.]MDY0392115.1 ferritin family protein [Candidatus Bipolaricaulis sp.]